MLGKNGTFSSTNWENEHYFETLSALTLKIRNFEWKTGTCVRSVTSESKSTLIMPASHGDISVDLQGSLTAQKRACMLLSIYYLMVKSCNTFGVATSPNVADLSTSFIGIMNLNMWSCPMMIIIWHSIVCSLDFRSTKRALFEVLSTKSSTKRRKNEGRSKH